jgi:hypothetical protein
MNEVEDAIRLNEPTLGRLLAKLPPTGNNGFETLIGLLLDQLTGFHFHGARSGDQRGRDGRASQVEAGSVVFESKRYQPTTSLNSRDLLAELQQSISDLPDLDIWILATSRNVPDQILQELNKLGVREGVDILPLECLESGRGLLDMLCAVYPDTVMDFLGKLPLKPGELEAAKKLLAETASSVSFEIELAALKKRLESPSCGWPMWQARSHADWIELMTNEAECRSRLGQPLNVLDPESNSVIRRAAEEKLDLWFASWPQTRNQFALLGEHGDGKSWAAAQWLAVKVSTLRGRFPPILFVPSRDGIAFRTFDELIRTHLRDRFGELGWERRLRRWKHSPEFRNGTPLAVVVLDGINERQSPGYWRTLLESSLAEEWRSAVAVICTARSPYWKEHFESLKHLGALSFTLPPFTDDELQQSLSLRGKRLIDFSNEIRPLLRKPRYLDLAARHARTLSQSGDFTPARLLYEDWRDRCSRRDHELSENEFNQLLREIAEKRLKGAEGFRDADLKEMLALKSDAVAAVRELATGGVLTRRGTSWIVDPSRVALGLGLLLSDRLIQAREESKSLKEEIASWLEPLTGWDLQSQILENAVLHTSSASSNTEIIAELLFAWINIQNPKSTPEQPIERSFVAYLPLVPEAYFQLAEKIWSTRGNHPWGQQVLIKGMIRWANDSSVFAKYLVPVLERWMDMIPVEGPPIKREAKNADRSQSFEEQLRSVVGPIGSNGEATLAGHKLIVISDDGWLRLPRAALAIISHFRDRRPHLRAITSGVISEAVFDYPEKADLFEWVLRSSRIPLWEDLSELVRSIAFDSSLVAQRAAARLRNYAGTEPAWKERELMELESLFPKPEWVKQLENGPFSSLFRWTETQLQAYLPRPDFQPWLFIHNAASFMNNPDLILPPDLDKRLEPAIADLKAKSFWTGRARTAEDQQLGNAEEVFSRCCPNDFAVLIRRIVSGARERSKDALFYLGWRLKSYDLLLDEETRWALLQVLKTQGSALSSGDSNSKIAEADMSLAILPLWRGNEQLQQFIERDEDCFDSIELAEAFEGPLAQPIPDPKTRTQWFRLFWFAATVQESVLSETQVSIGLSHEDSLVRGCALRYLYECCSAEQMDKWVKVSNWRWQPTQHSLEQDYGSLAMVKCPGDLPLDELLGRVSPDYRAVALKKNSANDTQWQQYAKWLDHLLAKLLGSRGFVGLPQLRVEHTSKSPQPPGTVSFSEDVDRSITFVRAESTWGGRLREAQPDFGQRTDDVVETRRAEYSEMKLQNAAAEAEGNYWLTKSFPLKDWRRSLTEPLK